MTNPGANQIIGAEASRLRSLAAELQAIAAALLPAIDPIGADEAAPPAPDPSDYTLLGPAEQDHIVNLARSFYRGRRLRSDIFNDGQLFGEPAWDMLLDLFIAEADGKQLSITAACIGAAVPTSTALRWLVILEDRGLVRRENDPSDARRVFLHLTGDGYASMMNYFMRLQREGIFTP